MVWAPAAAATSESTELCLNVHHQIYHADALHVAKRMRKEWMQISPFFIYATQKDYLTYAQKDGDREREYPHTSERFNMLGPVSSACRTPMEIYGGGDKRNVHVAFKH